MCDPPVDVLAECLASVREQDCDDWEHVVVDDASTDAGVHALLDHAATDPRVRVVRRIERGGIVAAGSDALELARGDVVALLDHDDVLAPTALSAMRSAFEDTECDVAYSDHDLIRPDGRFAEPFFKPDFSPERLRHQNYITHFVAARRSVVLDVGGFRSGFDGAQDHDLLLRLTEVARLVVHIPEILYHWRQTEGSVALDTAAKPYAFDNGRRAVEEHCDRIGIAATVEAGRQVGTFVVRRSSSPTVSLLVAAPMETGVVWGRRCHHLARLSGSLTGVTGVEIVIAVPSTESERAQRVVTESGCTAMVVEAADLQTLWSAALACASGEVVVPVTEAMVLDTGSDIASLAAHLHDAGVAIVGCPQLDSDRTVRHGGFVTDHLGTHPILSGWAASHPGPGRLMAVAREVGAVDVIGAALRFDDFRQIAADTTSETDITFDGLRHCVDRRAAGERVIWSPQAAWYRFAPPSRSFPSVAECDPYSNPNLSPGRGDWLELPGRSGAAPYGFDRSGHRIWS